MKYILLIICSMLFFSCSKSNEINETKISEKPKLIEKTVVGNSMEPLIKNGTKVLFQSGYYDDKSILEKNDIKSDIILYDYKGDKQPIIKQIVATDKDKVEIKDNTLYVNNKEYKNSIGNSYNFSNEELNVLKMYINKDNKIPQNSVFILGDNVSNSNDSRKFGAISLDDILGRVILEK